MDERVEVARFGTLVEADIAASYLQSHGVAAEVLDGYHGSAAPFLVFALGWFRLTAPQAQAQSARVLLAEADEGQASSVKEDRSRPRGLGDHAIMIMTLMLALLAGLPFVRKRWRRG